MTVIPIIKYALITIRHKWFVLRAGLRVGAPLWNLIIHDWSKFTPAELPHYGRQFFGDGADPDGFGRCWLHHQNFHPHHWEYWIPRTGHYAGGFAAGQPVRMPEAYLREMVADWLGANRGYEGQWPTSLDGWEWFSNKFDGLDLHPDTRQGVLDILGEIGIWQ